MKKFIAFFLCLSFLLTGCAAPVLDNSSEKQSSQIESTIPDVVSDIEKTPEFSNLSDPDLIPYLENAVYSELVSTLQSEEYFVENIQAVYVSKEYIDELEYNSKSNIFFGYTIAELDALFEGTRYVFALGDDGQTTVKEFEAYDDTYEQVLKNVAVGTGVIFFNITATVVSSAVGAYSVSIFFACSTMHSIKEGVIDGVIGGVSAGIIEGLQTKDFDAALKSAAITASDGFKWGTIAGTITGGGEGLAQLKALKGATLNGLTLNQASQIQMESKYPVEVIKNMHSMKEYEVFKQANLKAIKVNNKWALVRDIDWDFVDSDGFTNKQRVLEKGLSPVDSNGNSYQIHHVGQKDDSPLAILSYDEHKAYYKDLHLNTGDGTGGVDHGSDWSKTVRDFWKSLVPQ